MHETPDCFHLSVQNAFGFQQGNLTLKRHDLKFQDFKERLLELLRKNATAFKLVKYYAQVREALEAKAKDTEYIAVSELKDIALQFDETPDLENLLAYLKNFTNTVLYFPQNEVLKDRLYLNPTHISRDIYKILNKTVRENNGKFDISHIQTRLNCDEPEAERFVALMREFDLIFEKQDQDGKREFVTPQYLPEKDELSKDIQFFIKRTQFESAFNIQFKSFVPRSLMLRFIANNGVLSDGETYWRNGIIYESLVTHALIKVVYNHESLTFNVEVQDKVKQAIDMQNIVEQFVKLENSDDNIKISNDGKTYIELRTIRKLQHENRKADFYYEDNLVSLSEYEWLTQKQETVKSMTLEELKEKVLSFIAKAKIKEAMDEIAAWAHSQNQEQLKSDIALLKGDWADLSRDKTLGLLSNSEASLRQNQLNNKVLNLLNGLEIVEPQNTNNTEANLSKMNEPTEVTERVIEALYHFPSKEMPEGELMRMASLNKKELHNELKILSIYDIATLITNPNYNRVAKLDKFNEVYRAGGIRKYLNKKPDNIHPIPTELKPKIYFSYAWGDDSETGESREKIVKRLYDELKSEGYEVRRDKEDVGYKASIEDFMKEIGRGSFIVVTISDKYLKSANCMFELLQIYRKSNSDFTEFKDKIYPIVLGDAKIYDPMDVLDYAIYWQDKKDKLETKIKVVGLTMASGIIPDFDKFNEIANNIALISRMISSINTLKPKMLSADNFAEIKKAIAAKANG